MGFLVRSVKVRGLPGQWSVRIFRQTSDSNSVLFHFVSIRHRHRDRDRDPSDSPSNPNEDNLLCDAV